MGSSNGCLQWAGLTGSNAAAGVDPNSTDIEANLLMYGASFYGTSWSDENKVDVLNAVEDTARKTSSVGGGTPQESFKATYKNDQMPMVFVWGDNSMQDQYTFYGDCASFSGGGCSPGKTWNNKLNRYDNVIAFNVSYYQGFNFTTLATHELGHIFSYTHGGKDPNVFRTLGNNWVSQSSSILRDNLHGTDWLHSSDSTSGGEMFADMFTAWVFNAWNTDPGNINFVSSASSVMNTDMSLWIP